MILILFSTDLWHVSLVTVCTVLTSDSLLVQRLSLSTSLLQVTVATVSGHLSSHTKVPVQRSHRVTHPPPLTILQCDLSTMGCPVITHHTAPTIHSSVVAGRHQITLTLK